MSCAPTEDQVVEAARPYIERTEPLGLAKLLTTLQAEHQWTLSEKRLKKILIASGLRDGPRKPWIPVSSLDDTVPMPPGVEPRYFDHVKGRGLVATKTYAEGQSIFVEDAYVAAPPPSQLSNMLQGQICTNCFLPTSGTSLSVACGAGSCGARFCHRMCQSKAMAHHHALLCPGTNPGAKALLTFMQQYQWHSIHTVARMLARTVLTGATVKPSSISPTTGATVHGLPSHDAPATWTETVHHLDSFATVSELERRARNPGWELERAGFLPALQRAHVLMADALDPTRPSRPRRFPVPATALPAKELERLFSWDMFLQLLGRANINMESHGGMYLVHSHLNHDCTPNVSIRHMPGRNGVRPATRITAQALRSIAPGDELAISYVDPSLPVDRRRLLLWRDYCFGPCMCQRCVDESASSTESVPTDVDAEKASKLARAPMPSTTKSADTQDKPDPVSLEQELRTSLGF